MHRPLSWSYTQLTHHPAQFSIEYSVAEVQCYLLNSTLFAEFHKAFLTTLVIEPESSHSALIVFLWLSCVDAEKLSLAWEFVLRTAPSH